MSKFTTIELWRKRYGNAEVVYDYTGREMRVTACSNPNNPYHPTLDHIRPLSKGGCDVEGNIEVCHRDTNLEKADHFPHWKANGKVYRARKVKGTSTDYEIEKVD